MAAAASQIKALMDELARVVAEMSTLMESDDPAEGDATVEGNAADVAATAEATAGKLTELASRADQIKGKIEFLEKMEAKEKELRAVINRAAPVESPAHAVSRSAQSVKPYAIPMATGRLRAFTGPNGEERAYRAGMWYRAAVFGDENAKRWCDDHGVECRASSEAVHGRPGSLVIDEVLNTVIKLVEDYGTFPAYARRVPMSSDVLIVPRRTGGVTAEFVGENTLIPDSDPTWDKVTLVAKKLVVSNRCSSEFLEDSIINLADYITDEFARAFAEKIDECGWVGDGTGNFGEMTGVATEIDDPTHSASVAVAGAGRDSFEEINIDDLTAMVARLPLYAQRGAAWYISPAGYAASMQRMALSAGGVLAGGNTARELAGGTGLQFLGYPVRLVHSLNNTLGPDPGKIKILFGDLTLAAMYGVRRQMTIKTSSERYAELDQMLMLSTTRFSAVAHDLGDTKKAGPIVALKTP
jgi:HK97 family phage major capsid protein